MIDMSSPLEIILTGISSFSSESNSTFLLFMGDIVNDSSSGVSIPGNFMLRESSSSESVSELYSELLSSPELSSYSESYSDELVPSSGCGSFSGPGAS